MIVGIRKEFNEKAESVHVHIGTAAFNLSLTARWLMNRLRAAIAAVKKVAAPK